LGFPKGERPYLITLKADALSPFQPAPHPLEDKPKPEEGKPGEKPAGACTTEAPKPPEPVVIDLEGIQNRVVAFPVPEGRFAQIAGVPGKALFTRFEPEGALEQDFMPGAPP